MWAALGLAALAACANDAFGTAGGHADGGADATTEGSADAAGDPDGATGDAPTSPDAGGKLVAFTTSGGYNAVNPSYADIVCANEAEGRLPGRFVAWFSGSSGGPIQPAIARLVDSKGVPVQGPWYRVDGKRVVASRAALLAAADVPFENDLGLSATGKPVSGGVWTGTLADGGVGTLCSNAAPTSGVANSADAAWTDQHFFTATCGGTLSVYCFQVE